MNLLLYCKNFLANPLCILLKNLGTKQTIAKNIFWLGLSEGISMLLKFFLFIYIARILGATEYGKFAFALSFVGLFAVFFDPGIYKIINREFAKDKEKEKDFTALLTLNFILGVLTLLLIFVCSFFITGLPFMRKLIWILGAVLLGNSLLKLFYGFFYARQKMQYQAVAEIAQAFFLTGLGLIVLFTIPSVRNLAFCYLLSVFSALTAVFSVFHRKVFQLRLRLKAAVWKSYLKMSWPIASMILLGSILSNIDSTIMGVLNQVKEVGWYNAVQRIVSIVLVPAGVMSLSFLPALSRCFVESKEKLQRYWNYYMGAMIFFAIPLVFGGLALSQGLVDFVYDPSYFPSLLAFDILLFSNALGVVLIPFNHALFISNRQNKVFLIYVFAVAVNIVFNLILIPRYSLNGAAIATLLASVVSICVSCKLTLKFTIIKPFNVAVIKNLMAALLASLAMYLVIIQPFIHNLYIIWSVLAGIIVYLFFFLVLSFLLRYVKLEIVKNQ